MKNTLRSIAESFVLILLLPQIFVFLYSFGDVVKHSYDGWKQIKELAYFGLIVSRMAAPFLYLLYLLVCRMNRNKGRGLATFGVCFAAGYGGVVAWNLFVSYGDSFFDGNFSYVWSVLPVALCSGAAAACVALRGKAFFVPKRTGNLFLAE